jgi:predicted histone-like DNA-binding protein
MKIFIKDKFYFCQYIKFIIFGLNINFTVMKYKLIERGNPANPSAPKKWYASPMKAGTVTQKSLAREIADRSSLSAGDVANVIQNLLELLPHKLIDGNSVQLGDFGTFRVSFSSEGTATKGEFNTKKIKGLKILFTPSMDFKKDLSDIKFEHTE